MWLDIVIVVVIFVASIYGLCKGLIRGLFGFVALIGAIFFAYRYFRQLANQFPFTPILSNIVSFIIIFFAVFIGVSIVGYVIQKGIHFVSLGWIDRILGLLFGFLIGLFINWVICILIVSYTVEGEDTIVQSRFAPAILSQGEFLRGYLERDRTKTGKE